MLLDLDPVTTQKAANGRIREQEKRRSLPEVAVQNLNDILTCKL
jgi:hypothetical protein